MDGIDLNGVVLHGRYRIERPLGKGGMSAVYLARHIALDTPVAVKLIRDDLIEDETIRARFEREARAAARLTHPNVVHIYDFGSFERGAYIVMEYIEGVSLRQVLSEWPRLPVEEAGDLILQTSEAIAAAHAAGILHRDIKPENLMVYEDETGRRRVKVVDFGLAKHLSEEATRHLTGQRQMIGTPKYMAPERVSRDSVDERADVYALGVVLYEMIAGRPPFEGTFKEIIGKHLYEEPPTFADLGVSAPEPLEAAIRRALAKNPEDRTPSAVAFARDVAEALDLRLTPSGALASLGTGAAEVEVTRQIGSARLPRLALAGSGGRTRYGDDVDEESTKVRPRLPTLYIPDDRAPVERTADLPVLDGDEPEPRRPARKASVLVAVAAALVAFFAAAYGAWWYSSAGEAAERREVAGARPSGAGASGAGASGAAAPGATPRATAPPAAEPGPGGLPPGTVTIPSDAKTRIILEMDPKEIRSGAVLAISGASLEQPQMFPLKRVRDDLSWVVSDASRSIPGRMRLDDVLKPGETFMLLVRNRDGSTSVPKISVAPVQQNRAR